MVVYNCEAIYDEPGMKMSWGDLVPVKKQQNSYNL